MWSSDVNESINFEGVSLRKERDPVDSKYQKVETVVPCMIQFVVNAPSTEQPKYWGIPARMLSLVAIIRSIEETATKVSYNIEDETGTITAIKWVEAEKKSSDYVMEINTYVRIVGMLREQSHVRHILILRIDPLEDLNELTNHMLEVIYAELRAKALLKEIIELEKQKYGNRFVIENYPQDYPKLGLVEDGMSADQKLVYDIIEGKNDTTHGIERSEIKALVPPQFLPELDDILDFLVSEGHIYTTYSDDYFKTS